MAHANPYTPGQVETLEKAKNELVKLAAVVNQIIANQKLLQRDDGCLADCAVVPHTLSDEVVRMIGHFELLGAYAARPYQKGQVVTYLDRMYVCVAPHQGGTVMDTAAWRLIGKAGCGCEGEAAGSGCGQMTDGTLHDEQGRPIYPAIVTFTERHKDGNQIVSNGVVFSYPKNISVTRIISNNGKSKVFVDLGTSIVGGGVEYTYKSAEATFVSASINTRT